MPSITLNNPEDKATVKRFLSSPDTRIITATVARLYVAYPDPYQWTYSGIIGAVALVQTTNTFYLRIVDLLYGRGVVWEQELYTGFVYSQDKPFFHSFQTEDYIAGFSFANDHEADVFYSKVNGRAQLRAFKPVSSAEALARSKSAAGQGGNKIPLVNGKVDKSRIGAPSNFEHRAHIGWNQDVGFDAQNIDPVWLELYEELNRCGVSRRQINKDAPFIAEFINAHGGLEKANAGSNNIHGNPPSSPQRRPPPPPPPPTAPAAYHGYLPRPLAQVMASLSLGASSLYGTSPPTPQAPVVAAAELDAVNNAAETSLDNTPPPVGTTAPPPPPPLPPPPPPLPTSTFTPKPPKPATTEPLSISTSAAGKVGNGLRSPMEGSLLLASIREAGGVQGLRKTGGLRSPPPRVRPASPLGATNSQGDLVSALVAALQQRQTRVTYSDDEGSSNDDDDSWDADN
ncbi:MAG: hypothetical protein J3Q66DRAFT_359001 [Benniella sp.]|nr:MAG: hypothetical protein J3Q66DRAFT_359001 [Benniella sp.]